MKTKNNGNKLMKTNGNENGTHTLQHGHYSYTDDEECITILREKLKPPTSPGIDTDILVVCSSTRPTRVLANVILLKPLELSASPAATY